MTSVLSSHAMRTLWLSALVVPLAASAASPSGLMALEARPPATKVGGAVVNVIFEAPSSEAADLRCVASIGRISGPFASGPGRFACRLKPPAKGPTQVAIVVVYSVKANGPLGSSFVTVNGRGSGDYPRAVVFTRPALLAADGVSSAELNLFALDDTGAPMGAEFSKVTASAGLLSPLRPAGVGRAIATLTAPGGGEGIDIEVRLPDGGNKVNAQFRVTLTAAPPSIVSMMGPRRVINPGEPISISITLSSESGGPASGVLKLRTDQGRDVLPIEDAPGVYTATFSAPSSMPASRAVNVYATVTPMPGVPGKTVQATLKVPLGPQTEAAPIAAATTQAPPVKTSPRGALHVVFEQGATARKEHPKRFAFSLVDEDGDAFTPESVDATADVGEVKGVSHDGKKFYVEYLAPESDATEAQFKVSVAGKEVDGSGYVVIQHARAEKTSGFVAAVMVGGMSNLGSVLAPDVDLVAMYSIHAVKGLRIGLFVGIAPTGLQLASGCPQSQSTPAGSITGSPGCPSVSGVAVGTGGTKGSVSLRGTPAAVRADWGFSLGEADLYVGGSLGAMLIWGSATAGADSPSILAPALYMAGFLGARYPLGPGSLTLELRWSDAHFDVTSGSVEVQGNMGGPTALIGYQMEF